MSTNESDCNREKYWENWNSKIRANHKRYKKVAKVTELANEVRNGIGKFLRERERCRKKFTGIEPSDLRSSVRSLDPSTARCAGSCVFVSFNRDLFVARVIPRQGVWPMTSRVTHHANQEVFEQHLPTGPENRISRKTGKLGSKREEMPTENEV